MSQCSWEAEADDEVSEKYLKTGGRRLAGGKFRGWPDSWDWGEFWLALSLSPQVTITTFREPGLWTFHTQISCKAYVWPTRTQKRKGRRVWELRSSSAK